MCGRTTFHFVLFSILLGLGGSYLRAAETINGELVSATVDQGRYAIQATGQKLPFATGTLRCRGAVRVTSVSDAVFGKGQALTIDGSDGARESFQVFFRLPFVLCQSTLVNAGPEVAVLNKVPLMDTTLDLGKPLDPLMALGTGGLYPLAKNVGSYAWMAVADPASSAGVVGGWLTHERGSGVVFTKVEGGKLNIEARLEYGCLRLEPGESVASETFLLGWFADARLGLEAWADAVARHLAIKLPSPPVVYCTWYDNVHRRAGSAASTAELTAFAAKELKPYGFTCVQIDDGWQLGEKGNGPRKNFTGHDPKGSYPEGMKPTAEVIKAHGLTPGLWLLPFGGNYKDPFFASHQDWFVKKADGTPFDNPWGGTCLDMSYPGARDFVQGEMKQAMQDWGYRYFKLDGLYGGMGVQPRYINSGWQEDNFGDGVFHNKTKANVEVYRAALRMVRETVGPQSFILGCCAAQNMRTYAGSFGLVDAMRIGPDVGGTWDSWSKKVPTYGARNYHLNGRIWWCDPDPFYVRDTLTLDSARCTASWTALSGMMVSISDWLPTLPAERLDIIRRCIPLHRVTARPVDLFREGKPRVWLVSDERPDRQRRDVLGLYNWGKEAETMNVPVAGLGLPPADRYIAYDFWGDALVKPFTDTISVPVPGSGCCVLAVRPLLPRPFLLSTSRHVTQGILEVREERWDDAAQTLTGVSAVVGHNPYEMRIVAQSPNAKWAVAGVTVSAQDQAAGVSIKNMGENMGDGDDLVKVQITSPANREVCWSVRFGAIAKPLAELQRDLVNLRFGMFIHFSPTTYLDMPDRLYKDHAPPRQGKDDTPGTADDLSPALLNPTKLDCGQWADAAKSAGMRYAVLTAKHHDGFCLWPSKYSTYTVAQGCGRDVVREFVDAFRTRGLKAGLYYSIRDRTERIAGDDQHGGVAPQKIQLIKDQLTELLTDYGEILYIVFDAWGNNWHESPTFSDIPYAAVHDHIKALQPNCLVLNHSRVRYVSDVPHIEVRAGMSLPSGNDWPAVGGDTIQEMWFWQTSYPTSLLKPVRWIVDEHLVPFNARNVVFQLNCAPNRDGLMDDNVVSRLAEVGLMWSPPPPLEHIPDSWKDWPVPSAVRLYSGTNIAKGKPVRGISVRQVDSAQSIVDGDPKTSAEMMGTDAWLEVDLGKSYLLKGIHVWNGAATKNNMLERGFIFVSERPFTSDDPNLLKSHPGVETITINEPSGYPTPYPVGVKARYLRVVSSIATRLRIGELETFAENSEDN